MTPINSKNIGLFISRTRQEKGLTQTELAKRLGTSQSAVNRIEKGEQNVSIDMIDRISEVLNKQILSLNSGSTDLKIEGGHELSGSIEVKTSKNAAVGLLCASLLNHGVTKLKRVARIEEVNRIIEVLNSVGVVTKWLPGNDLVIHRPAKLNLEGMNIASAMKTRSIIMFLGPLMHEYSEFKIPYAGGCELGKRTVLPHIYALEESGVTVEAKKGHYLITVDKHLPKRDLVLYESGDTTTENAIMAAAGFSGTTIIKMASANYAIQDLCFFLLKLGVKIKGIGSTTLEVTGVKGPIKKNVTYSPSEDPIEAMTFISAAVATNSSITVKRVPIDFIELELLKLEKMGLQISVSPKYKANNAKTDLVDVKIFKHDGKLLAPEDKLSCRPFPGFNMDNLPYFVPIVAVAKGRSLIHDWPYEDRALMFTEMKKVGVDLELADPHRVFVTGPTNFRPTDLVCPNGLRPAVIILIGMLAAPGVSILRNVYTINRGYEDIALRLNSLGAKIEVIN
jgi:UDP-N-acetylglucosamine 1-carboxyvinyltransferase